MRREVFVWAYLCKIELIDWFINQVKFIAIAEKLVEPFESLEPLSLAGINFLLFIRLPKQIHLVCCMPHAALWMIRLLLSNVTLNPPTHTRTLTHPGEKSAHIYPLLNHLSRIKWERWRRMAKAKSYATLFAQKAATATAKANGNCSMPHATATCQCHCYCNCNLPHLLVFIYLFSAEFYFISVYFHKKPFFVFTSISCAHETNHKQERVFHAAHWIP